VVPNFERPVAQLRRRLAEHPPRGMARTARGDARSLQLDAESVDAVITSPPYLNAIDYMRGHRMSLVWLGHSIPSLRTVRSSSIGAERAADEHTRQAEVLAVTEAMRGREALDRRLEGIMGRYALDLIVMTAEIARVLRPNGKATFIVGNSCIKGNFIDNAQGVATATILAGMTLCPTPIGICQCRATASPNACGPRRSSPAKRRPDALDRGDRQRMMFG